MSHFSEYGFVNTKRVFDTAVHSDYAVPAFNFVCLEQILAIVDACVETDSTFILQTSANVRSSAGAVMVQRMAQACVEMIREKGSDIQMALHLDHGLTFEDCKNCVDGGYSSVMIDGSALSFAQNAELTKKVAEYAHQFDVSVEGELGAVSGAEDGVDRKGSFTDPEDARRFVELTGVDSLAVSVGTSHGLNKRNRVNPGEPVISFDRLAQITASVPGFPLVLHGASEIPQKYVAMINRFGGNLEHAGGVPVEELKRVVKTSVSKINVATDGWIAAAAAVRQALAENPGIVDPRKFLTPARDEMFELYTYKIREITNSAGRR